MGRRSTYSPKILEAICQRLEAGEPLAVICRDRGMPPVRTFLHWADTKEDVAEAYSRAREAQGEWLDAEVQRISETAVDKDSAAAARVKITALTWRASKMAPKRYGERVDLSVDANIDLASLIDRGRQRVLEARRSESQALPAPERPE